MFVFQTGESYAKATKNVPINQEIREIDIVLKKLNGYSYLENTDKMRAGEIRKYCENMLKEGQTIEATVHWADKFLYRHRAKNNLTVAQAYKLDSNEMMAFTKLRWAMDKPESFSKDKKHDFYAHFQKSMKTHTAPEFKSPESYGPESIMQYLASSLKSAMNESTRNRDLYFGEFYKVAKKALAAELKVPGANALMEKVYGTSY